MKRNTSGATMSRSSSSQSDMQSDSVNRVISEIRDLINGKRLNDERLPQAIMELSEANLSIKDVKKLKLGHMIDTVRTSAMVDAEVKVVCKRMLKKWKNESMEFKKRLTQSSGLEQSSDASMSCLLSFEEKSQPTVDTLVERKRPRLNECSEHEMIEVAKDDASFRGRYLDEANVQIVEQEISEDVKVKNMIDSPVPRIEVVAKKRHHKDRDRSEVRDRPFKKEKRNEVRQKEDDYTNRDHRPRNNGDPKYVCEDFDYILTRINDAARIRCRRVLLRSLQIDEKPLDETDALLACEIESKVFEIYKVADDTYQTHMMTRMHTLYGTKNLGLKLKVRNGQLSPTRFANMTRDELWSERRKRQREQWKKEAIDHRLMPMTQGTRTTMLTCGKCKEKDCTYTQLQTRSADEPMTTFVYCNKCGNRWKMN
ncbi:hypothetical protein ACOME3_003130 [Neoechinorhynchus agilis]